MAIELPALPFAPSALEPQISAKTLSFHYDKHHRGYVNKVNAAIEGTPLATESLEAIIKQTEGQNFALWSQASQVWNHNFFWQSLKPAGSVPSAELALAVDRDFRSLEALKREFKAAAMSQFGSGWAWLVKAEGKLKIMTTGNADAPLPSEMTPLLTLDVWEHAYYLDYQNDRSTFVEAVLDNLLNWDFAAARYEMP